VVLRSRATAYNDFGVFVFDKTRAWCALQLAPHHSIQYFSRSTQLITEREKLEFESLPEFVREPKPTREPYVTKAAPVQEEPSDIVTSLPKSAELEALWPGINHDFFHASPKKSPGFYLTIGFFAGVLVTVTAAWSISTAQHLASNAGQSKEIVVAQAKQSGRAGDGAGAANAGAAGEFATIVPLTAVYEVASGDTLAGIALKNYHRATPRLLDEICKANNMTNANVLNLGQKITLPEYHPQSRQIATGANQIQQ
jgi:LysM repeat protein